MELSSLRTLGRSGLPITPLALGTMTFGNKAWGSPDDTSQATFNAYIDAGGNFVDTADVYAGGRSEELVGAYIAKRKLRHQVVLATKFSFNWKTLDVLRRVSEAAGESMATVALAWLVKRAGVTSTHSRREYGRSASRQRALPGGHPRSRASRSVGGSKRARPAPLLYRRSSERHLRRQARYRLVH